MRADARRNRESILSAAVELTAERGAGVSMEEIARAAGLGVGTLYRHFPDRQALLDDVAVESLRDLLAVGAAAAAEDIPRLEALRRVVGHCVAGPLAMVRATSADREHAEVAELSRASDALLERMVADAQAEGTLRGDIPARAVVELLSVAVCRPGARADDPMLTVIFDGLRA